ncbi:MAG TPA: hypothetical protein P5082_12240, partial [Treponema sp.]|nr:hypothetical protein [Treponema sp.]
ASLDAGDGQAALVAFILTALVDAVQGYNTYEDKAAALYDQLIEPALAGTLTDENAEQAINSLFSTNVTSPNGATNLQNAFDAVLNPNAGSPRDDLYSATGIGSLVDLLGGN